jgi:hypothetical protein
VIDERLAALLDARSVRFCVIGATAMAARGWARYTADVDLLTMDRRVLEPEFWPDATEIPEIHAGDADDPLAGVVRWPGDPPHDLIVGRGYAMQLAVDTAEPVAALGCRVATPLSIVLLKLEAGGPQDRYDILSFVAARRAIDGAPWLDQLAPHTARSSASARACWVELEPAVRRRNR